MIPRLVDRYLSDLLHPIGAHYAAYKEWRWGDPHVRLLKRLCDPRRAAIDVGAHAGAYTYFLSKYSAYCYAFEPNPMLAARLRKLFPTVEVWGKAASDQNGTVALRTPLKGGHPDFNRSTVEPSASNRLDGPFMGVNSIAVDMVRLDDVIRRPVGMIKIDVEGHELAVLAGCRSILLQDRPNLVVELEERHHPGIVTAAFRELHNLGYRGYFVFGGEILATGQFDSSIHQSGNVDKGEPYVWNFIFSAGEHTASSLRLQQ